MNHELASALARARQRQLLHEAAERRRYIAPKVARRSVRRRLGRAIESLGYAFVALGEAIAWR